MFATRNRYEQIVRLLLEKGADVNVAGRYGDTALVKALLGDHNKQVVRLLLEYGAQPRDDWERQSIRNYGLKIYDRPGPAFTYVNNNSLHPIHYIVPLFSIFEIIVHVIFPNSYIYVHFFVPYIFSKSQYHIFWRCTWTKVERSPASRAITPKTFRSTRSTSPSPSLSNTCQIGPQYTAHIPPALRRSQLRRDAARQAHGARHRAVPGGVAVHFQCGRERVL